MGTKYEPNYMDIEDIQLNDSNPRNIDASKFSKLVKSIKNFPAMLEIRPIVIDENNVILGGNMRYKACIKAGLNKVPILKVENLSIEQKKEFIIKDNVGFGEWDWELLQDEWDADLLEEWGLDVEFETVEDNEGLTDEDDVPEVEENPISKLGDVWLLGEHRVMCGDSTSADVDLLIDGAKDIDLMTDPPYGINAEKMTLGSGKKDFYRGNWDSKIPDFFPQLKRFNKIILWGANYYTDRLIPSNDWLCWHKKNDGLSFSEFELAWSNVGKNCRHIQHHWSGEKKVHPTQKPYPVIEWAVKFLDKNIVDLFGGSGTTLIACEKTNRNCMMMELDPKYVDVIVKRWQEYTGESAIHADTGDIFAKLENVA